MGGSSTKVYEGIQTESLMDSVGELDKALLLDAGKKMNSGFRVVLEERKHQIADLKSLYNDGYLQAMGYDPAETASLLKLDDGKVLQYTNSYVDSTATDVSNVRQGSLSMEDFVIMEVQDYPNYNSTTHTFDYLDGNYVYITAVQNGAYVDATLANTDTESYALEYISSNFTDESAPTSPTTEDSWIVYNNVTIDSYGDRELVDGQLLVPIDFEVDYTMTTYENVGGTVTAVETDYTDTITEYIEVDIEYIQVNDTEYLARKAIVDSYEKNYTVSYESTSGNGDNVSTYEGTHTVRAYTDYLGEGKYSVTTYIQNYSGASKFDSEDNRAYARTKIRAEVISSIAQDFEDSLAKVIWYYAVPTVEGNKLHYIDKEDASSFYVAVGASAFPIIPLKVDRSIINSTKQDLMLKKIGLEGSDFSDTIKDDDIYDAYLNFGLPFSGGSVASSAYIYELMAMLGDVAVVTEGKLGPVTTYSKVINVSFSRMELTSRYVVDISYVENSSRDVGTYWKTTTTVPYTITEKNPGTGVMETTSGEYYYPTYNKQEGESYYVSIMITSQEAEITVAGYTEDEYDRYPLLRDITVKLPMNYYTEILERSMAISIYTRVEVKTKWYQSGLFKFIMFIVAIVITILSWGALSWVGKLIIGAALTVSALTFAGIDTGVFGQIVSVISVFYGLYTGVSGSIYLQVAFYANNIISLTNTVNNWYFQGKLERQQEALSDSEDELEEEQALYDEVMEDKHQALYTFTDAKKIDGYYDIALGGLLYSPDYLLYESAYDYDNFYS